MNSEVTIAINAGGKSSRMGTDKALLKFMGRPMIDHILALVANLGQAETLLITNHPDDYAYLNLPMFGDVLPAKGSLGGIYTALTHSAQPYTLVLACDMPFVNPKLLQYMLTLVEKDEFDVIVPRVNGYPEGLHAIYSQACRAPVRARLEADRLKVTGLYEDVRVCYIDEAEFLPYDPQGLSFFNVNTPEELAEAQRLAEKHLHR